MSKEGNQRSFNGNFEENFLFEAIYCTVCTGAPALVLRVGALPQGLLS